MNKKLNIAAVLLAGAMVFGLNSCKPESKGELGTAFDKVAGMDGTWKISKFSQVDLNNPIREERDLSNFYIVDGQEPLELTFNKADRTYTVVPGPGINFFGESGTWGFDNDAAPSNLYLYGTDTLEFNLGAMIREFDNNLIIQLPRFCDDGAGNRLETVIYKFEFVRQ